MLRWNVTGWLTTVELLLLFWSAERRLPRLPLLPLLPLLLPPLLLPPVLAVLNVLFLSGE
jgi:hypothetical protein